MMEEYWKDQFKKNLEGYGKAAPEGLFDEIVSSVDRTRDENETGRKDGKDRSVFVRYIMPVLIPAAAAVAAFFLAGPENPGLLKEETGFPAPDRIEANAVIRTPDPISVPEPPSIPALDQVQTALDRRSDAEMPDDGETLEKFSEDKQESPAMTPTRKRDENVTGETSGKDSEIVIVRKGTDDWQQLLIAENAKSKSREKISFNVYASGFPGGNSSHSGYSQAVTAASSAAPMRFGDSPLANILMFNRTKEVNTETRHFLPVRAGVTFSWNFHDRWFAESGIVYSWLLSKSRTGSDSYYMDTRQTLHYLGIPVNIGYRIWSNDIVRIYASAGGMMEKCIAGSAKHDYIYAHDERNSETDRITVKPLQWSVSATAGLQFNISRNIGLYAEPGLIWHFNNGSDIETVYSDQPLNFNLNLGLRFSFR